MVIKALERWKSSAQRHVVIGPGFKAVRSLDRVLARSRYRWRTHRGLPTLASLLSKADVAISAGGDTLFELACVGTPALVLYEESHEGERANAFQKLGFGSNLGCGARVNADRLCAALERLEDPRGRNDQSQAGKRIVDGRGAARVCRILADAGKATE